MEGLHRRRGRALRARRRALERAPRPRPRPDPTWQIWNEQNSPSPSTSRLSTRVLRRRLLEAARGRSRRATARGRGRARRHVRHPAQGQAAGDQARPTFLRELYGIDGARDCFDGVPSPVRRARGKIESSGQLACTTRSTRRRRRKPSGSPRSAPPPPRAPKPARPRPGGPGRPTSRGVRPSSSPAPGQGHRGVTWYSWRDTDRPSQCDWCAGSGLFPDLRSPEPKLPPGTARPPAVHRRAPDFLPGWTARRDIRDRIDAGPPMTDARPVDSAAAPDGLAHRATKRPLRQRRPSIDLVWRSSPPPLSVTKARLPQARPGVLVRLGYPARRRQPMRRPIRPAARPRPVNGVRPQLPCGPTTPSARELLAPFAASVTRPARLYTYLLPHPDPVSWRGDLDAPRSPVRPRPARRASPRRARRCG